MTGKIWLKIVNVIGGVYSFRKFLLLVHDSGIIIAKDSIVKFEHKF